MGNVDMLRRNDKILFYSASKCDNIKYSHVAMATEYHLTSTKQQQDLSPSVYIIPAVYFSESKSKTSQNSVVPCIPGQNLDTI